MGLNKDRPHATEAAFARDRGLSFPVVLGADQAFEDYAVKGIPQTVLIDRAGHVRVVKSGFGPATIPGLEAAITALLDRSAGD